MLAAMAVNKDGSTELTVWFIADGGGGEDQDVPPFTHKASSPSRWS